MVSVTSVDLSGVGSLTTLLQRLPQGRAAQELAKRLGLWSPQLHSSSAQHHASRAFPSRFTNLSDGELSDLNAYWNSEVFRATEVLGLVEGQRDMVAMEMKALEAKVRADLRRRAVQEARVDGKPGKAPTVSQLNDDMAGDARLATNQETLALLAVVLGSAKAYKEACLAACAAVSREISFRQAQMGARLR